MKIQSVNRQNFGVTIISDKISSTMAQEKELIGHYWGEFSPQYDYLYQMQQEIDDLHANGILDLKQNKSSFSLSLFRKNDFVPKIQKFRNQKLSTKLIFDFLKSVH